MTDFIFGFQFVLFQVTFWAGIIMMILHKRISFPFWGIAIVWLVVMAIQFGFLIFEVKYIDE